MTNNKKQVPATGFDLSSGSAVMKIYPLATSCWVKKDENIQPNTFSQPIRQYIYHNY